MFFAVMAFSMFSDSSIVHRPVAESNWVTRNPFAARYAKRGKPFWGWAIPLDVSVPFALIHPLARWAIFRAGTSQVPSGMSQQLVVRERESLAYEGWDR